MKLCFQQILCEMCSPMPNVVCLLNSSMALKNGCDVGLKAIATRHSEIEMRKH